VRTIAECGLDAIHAAMAGGFHLGRLRLELARNFKLLTAIHYPSGRRADDLAGFINGRSSLNSFSMLIFINNYWQRLRVMDTFLAKPHVTVFPVLTRHHSSQQRR
jgi:hypothetical protein